ncbi:transcription initiation factor TFIID subunit 8 [Linnemannia elongata]|nr:transcription initiation factor TFIID subunit 8 [Linnemannia elongata]
MSDVNSPGGQPSGANTPKARSQTTKTRTATSLRHQHSHPQHSMDSATAEATCKKLVSILALDAGYEGITASALESLTRVFENYTQQMYSIAHSFAELAGRTRPDINDLEQAFSDMGLRTSGLDQYIEHASQSKTPLLRGPLQEILAKPERKKEKKTLLLDSDIEDNSDSDEEEDEKPGTAKVTARTIVPEHLPAFPSKHSYKQTPVFVKRPTDPQKIRELNAEQSRLVESNLKKLMAAENKVAMAAAHKDGSSVAAVSTTADLRLVKEEPQESIESIDRRALTKLEALPVVNYEQSKRQQQVSASSHRDSAAAATIRSHSLHDMQGGHLRGDSHTGSGVDSTAGAGQGSSSQQLSGKTEWRNERRRLRKEQLMAMEGMEHNLTHKRIRQESAHSGRLKLVSMDVDP